MTNVFSGISYSKLFFYDNSWKVPTEINNTRGYWIKVVNDDILTVEGLIPEGNPINLNNGWNLIGYPSLVNSTISESTIKDNPILSYEETWLSHIPGRNQQTLLNLQPGLGYWVKK